MLIKASHLFCEIYLLTTNYTVYSYTKNSKTNNEKKWKVVMPRRREVPKRDILPDPKFGNVEVSKFVNARTHMELAYAAGGEGKLASCTAKFRP